MLTLTRFWYRFVTRASWKVLLRRRERESRIDCLIDAGLGDRIDDRMMAECLIAQMDLQILDLGFSIASKWAQHHPYIHENVSECASCRHLVSMNQQHIPTILYPNYITGPTTVGPAVICPEHIRALSKVHIMKWLPSPDIGDVRDFLDEMPEREEGVKLHHATPPFNTSMCV